MKPGLRWIISCAAAVLASSVRAEPPASAEALLRAMEARRPELERCLTEHTVYETATGMAAANRNRGVPSSAVEKLVAAENFDRQALHKLIGDKLGGRAGQEVGRERWNRYVTKLKPGILREDPRTSLLTDRWPPEVLGVAELLQRSFAGLDERERLIRAGQPDTAPPPDTQAWENVRSIVERMQERLPTLIALAEKRIAKEGSSGFLEEQKSNDLTSDHRRLIALENSDRREIYRMIALQVNDPGMDHLAVGIARAGMKAKP